MLIKTSQKAAYHRIESYKLTGLYYWLTGKPQKSFKLWRKAIVEGIQLGADLELSRLYFEVGKQLMLSDNKNELLDGLGAKAYLKKAKEMFQRMDLKWDLEELNKLVQQ